ncbi:GDP-L-fucose synthase family protein [Gordonibacter massiliensis (ex Traore et al. 2017)]|uniref:GDP-L-fucose synthase family protein n=1 Tax=Gordonibacter massiliensis (ex Traore et al. 2017) TaxID=1841863 RepID=UPI001C8C9432|nr:GDP-L-fucose synthase [Gordonibacter massiliensis (ex Traore et al. 2017)]MBX9033736.1 GDP-L-fucose synthase [Gordonibacter massiliensis (ex Traore et al. 2017)]
MDKDSKIYVAGHRGMVGSSIVRRLYENGYDKVIVRTSAELDLRNQSEVDRFFERERPDYVFLAAARVGGIASHSADPAGFLYDNAMIALNVIHAAYQTGVSKLLFVGSSCVYSKSASQPLKEVNLLAGPLEGTDEGYALAKIIGLKYCEYLHEGCDARFISVMPCNVYGQGDKYDVVSSHVVAGLIRKFHEAKASGASKVSVWGSGKAYREFMYVDDLSDACLFLMDRYDASGFVNVGSGRDVTIAELAQLIARIVGFKGEIEFDASMPEGMARRLLDVSKLEALGWTCSIGLEDGLRLAYGDYLEREGCLE